MLVTYPDFSVFSCVVSFVKLVRLPPNILIYLYIYIYILYLYMIQSYYEQTTITKEACGSVVCALSYCRHSLLIPNKLVASSG